MRNCRSFSGLLLGAALLLAVSSFFSSAAIAEDLMYYQVRIYLSGETSIRDIISVGIDPADITYEWDKGYVEAPLNDRELAEIANLGLDYEILISDLEAYYADRGMGLTMGGYHTYSEAWNICDSLQTQYPDFCMVDTIGYTHLNNVVFAVKISDNVNVQEDEPEVLYSGLTHAREPIGLEICLNFAEWLLTNYGNDPTATYLVDNRQIWIIPVVNPDGYLYNEQTNPNGGGMWRKNRRDNGGGIYGVDINRNFTFMWGYDNYGSSPNPSSETYRGPSAGSEPATQAVMGLCEEHEFDLALHYHSYGEYFIYPYGYDQIQTPDHETFVAIADSATTFNHYAAGQAWQLLYPVNGDAVDYSYGEQQTKPKIFGFTPEVGDNYAGFWPNPNQIPGLIAENHPVNIYIAQLAGSIISFDFPEGLPELINPDGGTVVHVEVSEGAAQNTGMIYYDYGGGYISEAMTMVEPDVYEFAFPAITCGVQVRFYFSVENANGELVYNPAGAPGAYYSAWCAYGFITIFEDDFETNRGWTVENQCSDGQWERGVPIGGGTRGDPPTAHGGSGACYLTDNEPGNSDVDDGYTWVISPTLDLTGTDPIVTYALWYTNNFGDNPNSDTFVVYISDDNGSTWNHARTHGPVTSSGWNVFSFSVSDFITPNDMVKVRFEASDLGGGSVVEAGLDDFRVVVPDCGAQPMVSIDMIPDDPPVTVPAGGYFTYTGILANNTGENLRGDVWVMLELPNGNQYGPLLSYNNVPLNPHQTVSISGIRQDVPVYAPLGTYDYIAYCGDRPSTKEDSASFEFTVTAAADGRSAEWTLSGWFDDDVDLPRATTLKGNYPNPFNAQTNISFDLAVSGNVKLEVYNLIGQKVETLVDDNMSAGSHTVAWDASNYSSGIYFYKLTAGDKVFTRRMTLVK